MKKTDKLLTIVLTTKHTNAQDFGLVIDALRASVAPRRERVQLLCIDQNEDERARAICGLDVDYVHSKETGLSKARNTAMQHVRTPWVLFLDDDAFVSAETFSLLLDSLAASDTSESFYGTVYDTGFITKYHRRASSRPTLDLLHFDGVSSIGIIWATDAARSVGLFDDRFGVAAVYGSSEESDLLIRLLLAGYTCHFLPAFKVSHPPEVKSRKKLQSYARGHGALYRKHIRSSWQISARLVYTVLARTVYGLYECLIKRTCTQFLFLKAFISGFKSYEDTTSK